MSIRKGEKVLAGISESDLTQDDVIDSLSSTATTLPLSANQGKILDEKIDGLTGSDIAATDPQSLGFTNAQGFIDVASEKLVDLESNFLTANKSVYVDATNGDDTTGDGSQEKPWATIQKAVDECPSVALGSSIYNIYLANGEYNEGISIINKCRISLRSQATENISIVINGHIVVSNTMFNIDINSLVINNQNSYCLCSDYKGLITIAKPITLNSDLIGLISDYKGDINVNWRAAGITINAPTAVKANVGFIHIYNKRTITFGSSVVTKYATESGGRIEFGSQGWQLIGSVTGANSVAIDSELYTEFLVEFNADVSGVGKGVHTIVVPSATLNTSFKPYVAGASNFELCIQINKTTCKFIQANLSSTSVIDKITMTVYGKR